MVVVALLRGINVGGANRLPMADLRRTLEGLGYSEVRTYIASGNVVLGADPAPVRDVADRIAAAVERELGVSCGVLVRAGADIQSIARAIPEHWSNGSQARSDVLYLFDAVDTPDVLARMPAVAGVDEVRYVPGAVLWSVDRARATRSGLVRIVGTELYRQVTVRNVNTARRLAAMVAEHPG